MLTIENAKSYVSAVLAGWGYTVAVTGAEFRESEMIDVRFDYCHQGETFSGIMSVWIADGALYGEW